MSKLFSEVAKNKITRSLFNLSYDKKLNCDMGQLIPIFAEEVIPGDHFTIKNEVIVRLQPLVAPILHEVWYYTHYFFVPYRLLWTEWEDFISRGLSGEMTPALPKWIPKTDGSTTAKYSLWDYLGLPVSTKATGIEPLSFPRDAYNLIYNEYFRDENLIPEVLLTNETILNRAWEKDYFTSAMLDQQRGDDVALPITGYAPVKWAGSIDDPSQPEYVDNSLSVWLHSGNRMAAPREDSYPIQSGFIQQYPGSPNASQLDGELITDFASAATFNVSDLREAVVFQQLKEGNQTGGVRHTEWLRKNYGVAPSDGTLQRPVYLGGSKSPIIISEVLQTSSTDSTTPQGNLAGHGISANSTYCGKYYAKEFGLIMGIMSIMPRSAYQQGMPKQWIKNTSFDFYNPLFAHLSEQPILKGQLYATDTEADNKAIFGYQGIWDELRTKESMVVAGMRDDFNYWHIGRLFDSLPSLTGDFVNCVPRKDIFAVQDEPGFIINFGNDVKAMRSLPFMPTPGITRI